MRIIYILIGIIAFVVPFLIFLKLNQKWIGIISGAMSTAGYLLCFFREVIWNIDKSSPFFLSWRLGRLFQIRVATLDLGLKKHNKCNRPTLLEPYEEFEEPGEQPANYINSPGRVRQLCKFHIGKKPSKENNIGLLVEKKVLKTGHFRFSDMYCSETCLNLKSLLVLDIENRGHVFLDSMRVSVLDRFSHWGVDKVFYLVRHKCLESPFISDIATVLECDALPIRGEANLREIKVARNNRILIIEPLVHNDTLLQSTVRHFAERVERKNIYVLVLFALKEFKQKITY